MGAGAYGVQHRYTVEHRIALTSKTIDTDSMLYCFSTWVILRDLLDLYGYDPYHIFRCVSPLRHLVKFEGGVIKTILNINGNRFR